MQVKRKKKKQQNQVKKYIYRKLQFKDLKKKKQIRNDHVNINNSMSFIVNNHLLTSRRNILL